MLNCLAVGVGGFVGAVLRYLVSMIPLDKTGSFPVNTLLINVRQRGKKFARCVKMRIRRTFLIVMRDGIGGVLCSLCCRAFSQMAISQDWRPLSRLTPTAPLRVAPRGCGGVFAPI